jgi:YidC/Oxa1 family membrane protein insertase
MDLAIISMGLLDPLYIAFGWIMRFLYSSIDNYGLVIIVFTVVLRGLMIPLGIHQQKSTIKQQSLQGEVAEIQRLYPNDKTKQSELQMALYKQHGASPLAGCLPAILQLIIIWPIFRIIQAPLQYIMNITPASLTSIATLLNSIQVNGTALITASQVKQVAQNNIPIINALNDNASAFGQVVQNGLMRVNQLIDVNFLGMNLGLTPSYLPAKLFGAEKWTYLPLLIFPLVVVLTTMVQMKITTLTMPNRKKKEEDKEREKLNPARAGQTPEDKTESMMKSMNIIMPIFMLWTTFTMPAAMGLYWIVGNIMMIIQSMLIYILFTRKMHQTAK